MIDFNCGLQMQRILFLTFFLNYCFGDIVQIEDGQVKGITESWGRIFYSIPYSGTPSPLI
jgi:hypothetical protein